MVVPVLLLLAAIPATPLFAQTPPSSPDSIAVSLLTCWPGREVYELDGHSALRVQWPDGRDSVWNYGVFDFSSPNFLYRFVKGETDYRSVGEPTQWFLAQYRRDGRRVEAQYLNLSHEQTLRLLQRLRFEALPQNTVYRYNYLDNNCATKLVDVIEYAIQDSIQFPDTIAYGTYRKQMTAFHRNYPWYQFGIDLALGSGLDHQLKPDQEMFGPLVMMQRFDGATFQGKPLVASRHTVNLGHSHATEGPTPWNLTPLFWSWLALAASIAFMLWQMRRPFSNTARALATVWFLLTGLAGLLIPFLVFISVHAATDPNILIWWLNPIPLVAAAIVWRRKTDPLMKAVTLLTALGPAVLLIIWPFQAQAANPAFFPLMGVSVVISMLPWIAGVWPKKTPKHRKRKRK